MNATRTIKIDADIADLEPKLERLIALAERFRELWGDIPIPDGIERLAVSEGDRVVFRYDGQLTEAQAGAVKEQLRRILPEMEPVILFGGLRLEGVLAAGGPYFDADAAPDMQIADKREE